ncbi:hypothetical protein ColTof4_14445 [Colletotrichum tofieldiae]|nr:hypothetical protein ColTof3_14833 [Colletotrichum tofieldiae]GKT82022.1 hypothetical protein ColTof4_14445 [Colletotrichum tofieldiae]
MSTDTPSSRRPTDGRRLTLVSKIESFWHSEDQAVIPSQFNTQTAGLSVNALQSLLALTTDATEAQIPLSALWEEPDSCLFIALCKSLDEEKPNRQDQN